MDQNILSEQKEDCKKEFSQAADNINSFDSLSQSNSHTNCEGQKLTKNEIKGQLISDVCLEEPTVLTMQQQDQINQQKERQQSVFLSCKQLTHNSEQVIKLIQGLINEFPMSIEIKYNAACFLLDNSLVIDKKVIVNILESSINMITDQSSIACRFRLAKIFFDESQIDEALQQLDYIIKSVPHSAALSMYGKIILQTKKQPIEALKYLKKSIRLCSFVTCDIYGVIGQAYLKLGKYQKAQSHLELSNKMNKNIKIQYSLGKCLLMLSKPKEALEIFQNLKEIPGFQLKAKLYQGICCMKQKMECFQYLHEITSLKDTNKQKILAIKIQLKLQMEKNLIGSLNLLLTQYQNLLDSTKDVEMNAIFSEVQLFLGVHPFVVMRNTELALGGSLFNQREEDDFDYQETEENIGNLVIEAKILSKIGQNEKAFNKIQNVRSIIKKWITSKQSIRMDPLQKKKAEKASWSEINWNLKADLAMIEICINLKKLELAKEVLDEILSVEENKTKFEVIHAQSILFISNGNHQSGLSLQFQNKKYDPSLFLLAQKLTQIKNYAEARRQVKIIGINLQKCIDFLKLKGHLEYQSGCFSASIKFYKEYLNLIESENQVLKSREIERQDKQPRIIEYDYQALLEYGEGLLNEGSTKEALKILKISLKLNYQQPLILFYIGKAKIERKKYKEALTSLQKSQQLEETVNTTKLIGECHFKLQNYEQAKEFYLKASETDPDDFFVQRSLGFINFNEKNYALSKSYFEKAIEKEPFDSISLIGIANYYLESEKDLITAESYFKLCLQNNKLNENCLEQYLLFLKKYDKKPDKGFLQQFRQLYSMNDRQLSLLGELFFKVDILLPKPSTSNSSEMFQAIIKLNEKAVQNKKEVSIANLRLAQLFYCDLEFKKSLEYLKKFQPTKFKLKDRLKNSEEVNMRAIALLLESKLKKQLNLIKIEIPLFKCIKLQPENEEIYFELAFHFHSLSNKKAWEYLSKGIKLQSSKGNKLSEQSMVLLGLQEIEKGNIIQAEHYFNECLHELLNSQLSQFYLGQIQFESKNYQSALDLFIKSVNEQQQEESEQCQKGRHEQLSFKQKAQARCNIIQILLILNEKEKALEHLSRFPPILLQSSDIQHLMFTVLAKHGEFDLAKGYIYSFNIPEQTKIQNIQQVADAYFIKAQINYIAGQKLSSIFSLDKCSLIFPNYPYINLKIASIYKSFGKNQKALIYYLKHLLIYPESTFALFYSSLHLIQLKEYSRAQSHIDRLFDILNTSFNNNSLGSQQEQQQFEEEQIEEQEEKADSAKLKHELNDDDQYLDSTINLSNAYYAEGLLSYELDNTEQSLISLNKSIQISRQNESSIQLLSQIYMQQGNYENEIAQYKKLISFYPSQKMRYYNNIGNAYYKSNQISKAFQLYSKSLSLPEAQQYQLILQTNLAASLIHNCKFDPAYNLLSQNIKILKTHAPSYYLIGIIFQKKGDIDNSIKFLNKSIKCDEDYNFPYLTLAKIYSKMVDKKAETIKVCEEYLEHFPTCIQMLQLFGDYKLSSHHPLDALRLLNLALQQIKREKQSNQVMLISAQCRLSICESYIQLNQQSAAIQYLQSHLNEYYEYPFYLIRLASLLLLYSNSEDQVFSLLNQAYNLLKLPQKNKNNNKSTVQQLLKIGDSFHQLKKYEQEVEVLQQCMQYQSEEFKEQINNNLGIAYECNNQIQLAFNIFHQALIQYPQSVNLNLNLGNLYLKRDNLLQAKKHYEVCLIWDRNNFVSLHNLGIVSLKLKNQEQAVLCFTKCVQINPNLKETYIPKLKKILQHIHAPQIP